LFVASEEEYMSHPGGRPSEYTPAVIDQLNQYLKEAVPENMSIPTVEGLALELGITKKTLYNWSEQHEEFLHALEELKMRQKEALVKTGIFGGKEINATIIALLLKVNHDMTDKVDITSQGQKLEPTQIIIVEDKPEE
jgi:hypothetical protein